MHDHLLSHLHALETALQNPAVRRDPAQLERLLHPRFREFGRSGRSYDRAAIVAWLTAPAAAATPARVLSQDFHVEPLDDALALLTYRSAHVGADGRLQRHTLRSSIWRRGPHGWQMLFHQGTPTDAFEAG